LLVWLKIRITCLIQCLSLVTNLFQTFFLHSNVQTLRSGVDVKQR
jgi:hypothetical protein